MDAYEVGRSAGYPSPIVQMKKLIAILELLIYADQKIDYLVRSMRQTSESAVGTK